MNQKVSIFFLVIFSLSMASCSIQKRRYNKGFHVEWFHLEGKKQAENQTKIHDEDAKSQNHILRIEHVQKRSLFSLNSQNIEGVKDLQKISYLENEQFKIEERRNVKTVIPAFKSGIKEKKKKSGDGKSQMMKGIMYMIIGGIIFWFISILAGGILMAIGFILFLIGVSNLGKEPKPTTQPAAPPPPQDEKPEYQDVVYLKNGSIIRGMIIEQIPNVSIKIQTADANVFVFKMDEIEKITKEVKP
ncbi:MAG: hypothetical protein JXR19_10985 [Bacteroidia bacterium]